MTREMIFDQLDRTIRKMRTIRMFQVLFDCAVVYGIICVIVDGTRVTLFNQTMVQNNAMIVVLLIGAFIRHQMLLKAQAINWVNKL